MVSALCLVAGTAYWIAGRRPVRLLGTARRWSARSWRASAFAAALLLIGVITGPLDSLARQAIWLRTSQLMLLLMVAGPLLVLGAPSSRFARVFTPSERDRPSRVRPLAVFGLFSGLLVAAYVPPVYRLTSGGFARQLALIAAVIAGYAFWAQVIAQPARPCALSHLGRMAYLLLSSVQVRVIGLVLGFAPVPLYGAPLVDQEIAAGILIVPGVLTDLVVLTVCLYLWLAQDARGHHGGRDSGGRRQPRPRSATSGLAVVRGAESA